MHTNDKNTQKHSRDIRFTVLSVLGMIFIVDGHLNNSFLDWGGMFPYYSFHVPLFLFISGYFYRPEQEAAPRSYVRRKLLRLLLPCLAWNVAYGIMAQLLHRAGFSIGGDLSLHNLFIEPFITGHQFVYNLAAWFVPALFLVEVVNLFLRRLMGGMIKKEWFLTLLYLVIGISGILLAMSGKNTGPWLPLVRTMFFLPIYQFGVLYRAELERHDSWNGFLYFGLLFLIQMFLHLKGYRLVYEAVFCRDFTNPILPYVTEATGIAFWLRIARLISPAFEKNRAIRFFGSHTYTVMLHHLTALMAAKTCFALLAKTTSLFPDFDFAQYKSNIWYYYFPDNLPQFRILFLLLAICLPLGVRYGWEKYGRKQLRARSMC